MDFFTCAILCGVPEGISAGDSDGESIGQSAGRLDGMLEGQPDTAKSLKLGELDGLSLGPQSTGLSVWQKTWGFGWRISRRIGR